MKALLGMFKSKTFWLNAIGTAAVMINAAQGQAVSTETAAAILAVLNVINRFLTKKPLAEK